MKQPNAKWHFIISLFKSIIRILGCVCAIYGYIIFLPVCLLVAEVLGIVEELL